MEKKSYISSAQIILLLFITRLLFSSAYQSAIKAGNNVQDMLLAIPVDFIINFIIAIPLLMLLKRHPGHDPIECTIKIAGKGAGSVVAVIFYLFFILNAAAVAGNYENFFSATMIPDVNSYVIGFFLLIVCIYGALKGIEAIARVGAVVAVIYMITLLIIFLSIMPLMDMSNLKPIFYTGPSYFTAAAVMNYNLSTQILALAFLAPFMRQGGNLGKTYTAWNIISAIVLFLLMFNIVTVTGAFGAKQVYPLQTLASLTKIGVFERLEAVDMVSWILNTVVTVTLYLYLAISCMLKLGLNKHRRLLALISGIIVFFGATYVSRHVNILQVVMVSGKLSVAVTLLIVIIPLILLVADLIKGRVMQNEQDQQTPES